MSMVLMMGPPGAGKGTQALRLKKNLHWDWLSMGDLLRSHVEQNSKLGRVAHSYMKEGKLVPDDLLVDILFGAMHSCHAPYVILDGYPRTLNQAQTLAESSFSLSIILHLSLDEKELTRRIAGRARSEGRDDDTPEKFKTRLAIYHREMAEVFAFYKKNHLGQYCKIIAGGSEKEVFDSVMNALQKKSLTSS